MASIYAASEYYLAAISLILAMAGMGATLTLQNFRDILVRPFPVALVVVLQYTLFPVLAALIGHAAGFPPGIVVGLVLMNAVPSGSLTNVFTYLGRGNVTLSILLTCASTLVCFVTIPLIIKWLTPAEMPQDFRVPFSETVTQVVYFALLPMTAGMAVSSDRHFIYLWIAAIHATPGDGPRVQLDRRLHDGHRSRGAQRQIGDRARRGPISRGVRRAGRARSPLRGVVLFWRNDDRGDDLGCAPLAHHAA
jgi:hypothetical protein